MTAVIRAKITGKRVLILLAASFGIVFAVNGFFVYKALSTAPGEESGASYEAGLNYNATLAAQRAQDALRWRHQISQDKSSLRLALLDAAGKPVTQLALDAEIERPAKPGRMSLAFKESGEGIYQAPLSVRAGTWIVSITAKSSGSGEPSQSLYRLKERIWIPEGKP
jgi:nitrogen fixation protein FixH